MLRRLALVLALVTLLGACSDDSGNDLDAGSSTGETVPDTADRAGSPEEASQRLAFAWADGDEETASVVAEDGAVEDLFTVDYLDDLSFDGCHEAGESFECSYSGPEDLPFTVEGEDEGFRVTAVETG